MSSDNNEARQVQIAVADPTPLGQTVFIGI